MTLTAALFLDLPPVGMERLTRVYGHDRLYPGGGLCDSYRGRRGTAARNVRREIADARGRVRKRKHVTPY